jgi:hypothetical protein
MAGLDRSAVSTHLRKRWCYKLKTTYTLPSPRGRQQDETRSSCRATGPGCPQLGQHACPGQFPWRERERMGVVPYNTPECLPSPRLGSTALPRLGPGHVTFGEDPILSAGKAKIVRCESRHKETSGRWESADPLAGRHSKRCLGCNSRAASRGSAGRAPLSTFARRSRSADG